MRYRGGKEERPMKDRQTQRDRERQREKRERERERENYGCVCVEIERGDTETDRYHRTTYMKYMGKSR